MVLQHSPTWSFKPDLNQSYDIPLQSQVQEMNMGLTLMCRIDKHIFNGCFISSGIWWSHGLEITKYSSPKLMEQHSHGSEQEIDNLFTEIANTQEFEDATSSTLTIASLSSSMIDNQVTPVSTLATPPAVILTSEISTSSAATALFSTTIADIASVTLPTTATVTPAAVALASTSIDGVTPPAFSTIANPGSVTLPTTATLIPASVALASTSAHGALVTIPASMAIGSPGSVALPTPATVIPATVPLSSSTYGGSVTLALTSSSMMVTSTTAVTVPSSTTTPYNKRPGPRYFTESDPKVNKQDNTIDNSSLEFTNDTSNKWKSGGRGRRGRRGHRGSRGYRGGSGYRGHNGRRGGGRGGGSGTFTININL